MADDRGQLYLDIGEIIFDDRKAGAYIGHSARHIRRLREKGLLAYSLTGKGARIRKSDLDQFLADRRVEAGPAVCTLKQKLHEIAETVRNKLRKSA